MNLVKILIAGTAVAMAAPAFAGGSDWHQNSYQPTSGGGCDWNCQTQGESVIANGQVNDGTVWSKVNADVQNVDGDVNLQASAVGNTAEIVTMNDTYVDNTQVETADVGSTLNANVDSVNGYVNLNASTACNSVDVSTDPNETAVNNSQTCGGQIPRPRSTPTSQHGRRGHERGRGGQPVHHRFQRHALPGQQLPAQRGRGGRQRERARSPTPARSTSRPPPSATPRRSSITAPDTNSDPEPHIDPLRGRVDQGRREGARSPSLFSVRPALLSAPPFCPPRFSVRPVCRSEPAIDLCAPKVGHHI